MKTSILTTALVLLTALQSFGQIQSSGMVANEFNLTTLTADRPISISEEQKKMTPDHLKSHPEYGILPHKAPCTDCYELLEERKDSSRMFVKLGTKGKEFYSQAVYGVFHYEKDGYKISYDPRLKRKTNTLFMAEQQELPTFLNILEKQSGFVTPDGNFTFNNKIDLIYNHRNGSITNKGTADWSNYTIGDEGIYITNAWENIDIQIVYHLDKIKLNYVITAPLTGINDVVNIQFMDHHQLPNGYQIRPEMPNDVHNGLYYGKLLIYDQNERVNFEIGHAYGYDKSEIKENEIRLNYEFNVDYLKINVPTQWLNSGLQYPVNIDPLVTATATHTAGWMSFQYNGQYCGGTGSCSYLLNVPKPPNTTIIQVLSNTEYETLPSSFLCLYYCSMKQAGFKISGPCGVNPSDATTYWSCNSVNMGTCTGTGLDITNTAICVTPSCTGTIPFIIQNSYCYCNIGGNCGNNCQRMNSNTWSITLVGRTLELPGNQNINLASCSGLQTLNALPTNGVPGYSYSWSTGGNTSSINITNVGTYTVNVTDNCNVTTAQTFIVTCPLAIDLVHFSAVKTGKEVLLAWETINEKNNDFFTIQKKTDYQDWLTIATIKGKENSAERNVYTHIDKNDLQAPHTYYRLKQTDKSGEEYLFDPILVKGEENEEIEIYPQPARKELNIKWSGFNGKISVFNLLGSKVDVEYTKSEGKYLVDTSNLTPGVYIIQFDINGHLIKNKRIVIE